MAPLDSAGQIVKMHLSDLGLNSYNDQLPIIDTDDDSDYGMSAVLLHKSVFHALTTVGTDCPAIWRGHRFTLYSDHATIPTGFSPKNYCFKRK